MGASEKGKPRRRASRCRAITTGETDALSGETIDVRCFDVLRFGSIAADVSVAKVVSHDDDDVGLLS